MSSATSPNQEGVAGTDSEDVWMITEESAILFISTSLLGTMLFFLIKEAYFYARSLLVPSRCAIRGQDVPLVKGALWIADMGYFALVRLVCLSQAGAYFLMPLKDGVVTWLVGKRVDLLETLQAHAEQDEQEYEIIM